MQVLNKKARLMFKLIELLKRDKRYHHYKHQKLSDVLIKFNIDKV